MSFGLSASDIIALPSFAWQVYKKCRDSSDDFVELSSEVASLHAVLSEVQALFHQYPGLGNANGGGLAVVLQGCHDVLKHLDERISKYQSLGTRKKRLRDRVKWFCKPLAMREFVW